MTIASAVQALRTATILSFLRGLERRWLSPRPPTPSPTFEPYRALDEVPPQPPLQGKGKGKLGKGTHKRTISAAISNTEREATEATEVTEATEATEAIEATEAATRKSASQKLVKAIKHRWYDSQRYS